MGAWAEMQLEPDSHCNLLDVAPTANPGQTKAQVEAEGKKPKKPSKGKGVPLKEQPNWVAAKARAKSTGPFMEMQRALRDALSDADAVLTQKAPKILGDKAENDPSLDLLRKRRAIVSLAMDASNDYGPVEEMKGRCLEDPFLRELTPLLEDAMTIGVLGHQRSMMDLRLGT